MGTAASFIEDEEIPSLTIGQPMTEQDLAVERSEHMIMTGSKPRPWSHSALDNFVNCPHAYHEVKVLKRYEDVKGEAAIWGDRVHVAIEEFLRDGKPLGPEFVQYQAYCDRIKAKPGTLYVEHEMCLNSKMQPCKPFDPGVFVRGYADVVTVHTQKTIDTINVVADVIDHKTGKVKENSRQMMLMAILTFAHFPEVEIVHTSFEWLKFNKTTRVTYFRSAIPELWNEFLPLLVQYRDAFRSGVWQKRQSGLCYGWCHVKDCEFWKPKRIK